MRKGASNASKSNDDPIIGDGGLPPCSPMTGHRPVIPNIMNATIIQRLYFIEEQPLYYHGQS